LEERKGRKERLTGLSDIHGGVVGSLLAHIDVRLLEVLVDPVGRLPGRNARKPEEGKRNEDGEKRIDQPHALSSRLSGGSL
jgi:hypothetical protein